MRSLTVLYEQQVAVGHLSLDCTINEVVLDSYHDFIDETTLGKIEELLLNKSFIKFRIINRVKDRLLFRQPVVLLIYLLVSEKGNIIMPNWPLGGCSNDVEMIFSDLAINFD